MLEIHIKQYLKKTEKEKMTDQLRDLGHNTVVNLLLFHWVVSPCISQAWNWRGWQYRPANRDKDIPTKASSLQPKELGRTDFEIVEVYMSQTSQRKLLPCIYHVNQVAHLVCRPSLSVKVSQNTTLTILAKGNKWGCHHTSTCTQSQWRSGAHTLICSGTSTIPVCAVIQEA